MTWSISWVKRGTSPLLISPGDTGRSPWQQMSVTKPLLSPHLGCISSVMLFGLQAVGSWNITAFDGLSVTWCWRLCSSISWWYCDFQWDLGGSTNTCLLCAKLTPSLGLLLSEANASSEWLNVYTLDMWLAVDWSNLSLQKSRRFNRHLHPRQNRRSEHF